jgi:hypothetical protein
MVTALRHVSAAQLGAQKYINAQLLKAMNNESIYPAA